MQDSLSPFPASRWVGQLASLALCSASPSSVHRKGHREGWHPAGLGTHPAESQLGLLTPVPTAPSTTLLPASVWVPFCPHLNELQDSGVGGCVLTPWDQRRRPTLEVFTPKSTDTGSGWKRGLRVGALVPCVLRPAA